MAYAYSIVNYTTILYLCPIFWIMFILKMQQVPMSALNIAKNLICFDLPKNKIHNQTDSIEELHSF